MKWQVIIIILLLYEKEDTHPTSSSLDNCLYSKKKASMTLEYEDCNFSLQMIPVLIVILHKFSRGGMACRTKLHGKLANFNVLQVDPVWELSPNTHRFAMLLFTQSMSPQCFVLKHIFCDPHKQEGSFFPINLNRPIVFFRIRQKYVLRGKYLLSLTSKVR